MDVPTSRPAAHPALSLPEIVEAILSHLPWPALFLLQRVDRTFLATIAGSASLRQRRALHTIAAHGGPLRSAVPGWGWEPHLGLSPIVPELLSASGLTFGDERRLNRQLMMLTGFEARAPSPDDRRDGRGAPVVGVPRPYDRRDSDSSFPGPAIDPEGSWRHLHIVESPLAMLRLQIIVSTPADGPPPAVGEDGAAPRSRPLSTPRYWEDMELRRWMTFGDLVPILREVTGRTLEEHTRIWENLSADKRYETVATAAGRADSGRGNVVTRRRRKY